MYGPHARGSASDESPINCLAVVQSLTFEDLHSCAAHQGRWERTGLATPLILTREEFARSLDAFPLEYGEIIDHHLPILGDDPLGGARVSPADLRRACEVQAKSHLLHLREGYLESGGRADEVAQLVTASAAPLAALLSNVGRLQKTATRTWLASDLARVYEEATGGSSEAIRRVLPLASSGSLPAIDAPGLYPNYLRSIEQLARALDRWEERNARR